MQSLDKNRKQNKQKYSCSSNFYLNQLISLIWMFIRWFGRLVSRRMSSIVEWQETDIIKLLFEPNSIVTCTNLNFGNLHSLNVIQMEKVNLNAVNKQSDVLVFSIVKSWITSNYYYCYYKLDLWTLNIKNGQPTTVDEHDLENP